MSSTVLNLARTLQRLRDGPNPLERLMQVESDDLREARLVADAQLATLTILAALKPSASGFY